ncbi:MAG TPA: hypothetical protein PL009_14095 [Flavipsychrobacter sp.]|nr:hypothetical protein [Flavipsychrobacter sp.]
MEGTEKVDERYKTGFEYGYWMTKAGSIEYDGLLKRAGSHEDFSKGLVAGKIEAKEAEREQIRKELEAIKQGKGNDKGHQIG